MVTRIVATLALPAVVVASTPPAHAERARPVRHAIVTAAWLNGAATLVSGIDPAPADALRADQSPSSDFSQSTENIMLRTILSTLVLLFAFGAAAHAAECCDGGACCEEASPCCDE